MTKGTCRACRKEVEYRRPRGWNLRRGLVVIPCLDGEHHAYLNPSGSYEANCQLAALNADSMRMAGEYHIHGMDCGELVTCAG
jgi:hypothetical protein